MGKPRPRFQQRISPSSTIRKERFRALCVKLARKRPPVSIRVTKAQKLTEAEVRFLRAKNRESPINAAEAARTYGVGAETIRRMLRFETWPTSGEGMTQGEAKEAAAASQEKFLAIMARDIAKEREKNAVPDKLLDELSGIPEEGV